MAVALLMPALAAPASALDRTIKHGNQACLDGDHVDNLLSGQTSPPGWASQTGAFASIDFHYDNCGDDDSAVAAWVALVPDNNPTGIIVQAGIIQCREGWTPYAATDPCYNHPNELRYFYAYGGCQFLINGPVPRDAGPATAGYHSYKVVRRTDGWEMSGPWGTTFLSTSNPAIGCVSSSMQTSTQFGVEKWDRGDSSGGQTTSTTFNNMEHYTAADGWQFFTSASGVCQQVMSTAPHTSFCAKGGDGMNAWD